ncbi:MAG: capsular polysaccharide export protein, LipB/KpsS family [Paracoccaceae bacterium]
MDGAKDAGARRLFFELAPLSGRVTIDPCGVNFFNSLPRNITPYLNWFADSGLDPDAWRNIGKKIQQRTPLKAGKTGNDRLPPLSDPFLFVPLQTPGDSQLRLFGGNFRTVEAFINCMIVCAKHLPQNWHLRIKEHPTAPVSFADQLKGLGNTQVFLDNRTDTFEQVAASRGVITVNSSVGLEAMFYDRPVIATGQCFWAIEGVAHKAVTQDDIIQLFAAADTLGYDRASRTAFMSYLTHEYYPLAPGNSHEGGISASIAKRICGPDSIGFWGCQESKETAR